jgi:hypothetical protein
MSTSVTTPVFGADDHPAGQITLSRRDVSAKVSALAGYRMEVRPACSGLVSQVEFDLPVPPVERLAS